MVPCSAGQNQPLDRPCEGKGKQTLALNGGGGREFAAVFNLRMGFPSGSDSKESACNTGDLGSIPGEGTSYPLQYSCLENSIPWTEKPGGLQPMGSQRVRHDWAANTSLNLHTDINAQSDTWHTASSVSPIVTFNPLLTGDILIHLLLPIIDWRRISTFLDTDTINIKCEVVRA